MPHLALRDGSLRHVAMAPRASDMGLIVRGVPEANQSIRRKPVHALPGDLPVLRGVRDHLFHFGLVGREFLMTEHALGDRWNTRFGANVGAAMTIDTLQAEREMLLMGVLDGLAHRARRRA